jgi:hypothetical protein
MGMRGNVTGVECNWFIVCDTAMQRTLEAADGRVLVFFSQEAAQFGAELAELESYIVVGMGDKTWDLFKAEQKYVVVGAGA